MTRDTKTLDEMRADLHGLVHFACDTSTACDVVTAIDALLAAARAEANAKAARVREALEQVITKCHHEWCGESAVSEAFCDSCKVARAALGRTTK